MIHHNNVIQILLFRYIQNKDLTGHNRVELTLNQNGFNVVTSNQRRQSVADSADKEKAILHILFIFAAIRSGMKSK